MTEKNFKSQPPQVNFSRVAALSQQKTNKSHGKTQLVAPQQLGLFSPPRSRATVGIEAATYRTDRYCVTVRQPKQIWQLCPSLPKSQAYDLLSLLQEAGCCFQLDENEGTPVDGGRLHALTECFINSLNLRLLGGEV